MPINAYTGLMGSGKSYECVTSVIIPAVKEGRRVVTNVDGIDSDAIRAWCHDKFDIAMDKLGEVVHCTNDDVPKANFLPYAQDADTFCKPGDIVCIDEAWRFWGTDCKLLAEHKVFFREHRHFVHPDTKVSCDLVLMVQDISDLHRTLKVVVEITFRTTKIKSLGMSKTYRVEMWEGYKLTRRGRVAVQNKRYDLAVFPLYSSYVGGAGKELQVDKRQNVLRNPKLWLLVAFLIGLLVLCLSVLMDFFSGSKYADKKTTGSRALLATPAAPMTPGRTAAVQAANGGVSATWRLVGTLQAQGKQFVVIEGQGGRMRLEHPSAFMNAGAAMVGEVDGQRVMLWSGTQAPTGGRP